MSAWLKHISHNCFIALAAPMVLLVASLPVFAQDQQGQPQPQHQPPEQPQQQTLTQQQVQQLVASQPELVASAIATASDPHISFAGRAGSEKHQYQHIAAILTEHEQRIAKVAAAELRPYEAAANPLAAARTPAAAAAVV